MARATRSPGFETQRRQAVGHAIGIGAQFGEGHGARFAAFAFPNAGDAIGIGPAVEAIVRDVEFAADEPLRPFGSAAGVETSAWYGSNHSTPISRMISSQNRSGSSRENCRNASRSSKSEALHEAPDVGLLDEFAGGFPDHSKLSVTRRAALR